MKKSQAHNRTQEEVHTQRVGWGLQWGASRSLGVLFVALFVGLVYAPATDGPFIFDDNATIVDNLSIRQLWPLVGQGEYSGPLNPPKDTPVYGRPLVNLTFAINYYIGGFSPVGYRVANLAIHILSALLLWAIVAHTLQLDYFQSRYDRLAEPLAFVSALIWALHPLVTECVVYVTQRTELMMGLFYLVALYCAIRYWSTSRVSMRIAWLVMATSACVVGMLCKEMIASVPAMVLLYERTFVAGTFRSALVRSWRLYVGLALTWGVAIVMNIDGLRTPMTGFDLGVTATQWWLTQTQVFFMYLKLVVWPWPLVIHYDIPYLSSLAESWPWLAGASLYGVVALALLWRRKAVGYVMAWVIAVLSPTLVIPLVGETAAERRMYVPLMALTPLIVVGGYALLEAAWQTFERRIRLNFAHIQPTTIAILLATLLALGFGLLSTQRLAAYQDGITLWRDALLHQPNDPLVRANLGISLAEDGQFAEATEQFHAWTQLKPNSHWAHYNLARSCEGLAKAKEAMQHYRRVLELQPGHAATHYNFARLLEDAGKWPVAIKHYRRAIDEQPDFYAAHTNLGMLLLDLDQPQLAIEHLKIALEGQVSLVNYQNLTLAFIQADRSSAAMAVLEKAIRLAYDQGESAIATDLESVLTDLQEQEKDALP